MKTVDPIPERLFPHFLDPVDGTLCLPASSNAADIAARVVPHRLRFPLLVDPEAPLHRQLAAVTYAPASCRFGPLCDNILGVNWRLPGGQTARIGERVVKTTTGYDWLRFLLHSGSRLGEPIDYVLRLRPDSGFQMTARLDGPEETLRTCVGKLLRGGWMHWWENVDFVVDNATAFLRVGVYCPADEGSLFEEHLTQTAAGLNLGLNLQTNAPVVFDGLPDVTVKTTPDRAIVLATELARRAEKCVAFCYNGVVHVHLGECKDIAERAHALMQPYLGEVHAIGGDWHSRWLPATPPSITESQWIETLEQAIHEA